MAFRLLIVIEDKKMENYQDYINQITIKIQRNKKLSEQEKLSYADYLVNGCSEEIKEKYPTITRDKNARYNEMNISLEELREKEFEEE